MHPKKILLFLSIIVLVNLSNAGAFGVFLGKVKTDNVNVRLGANINFESITKLDTKDKVKIVDELYGWYKIELNNLVPVYVSSKYVKFLPDSELAQVKANSLNVRMDANMDSVIIGQIPKKTIIKIKTKINDFYEIDPKGIIFGWVNKFFIEKIPPKIS